MASVLIVEDDGVAARQMAHTLRRAGHKPILAADGHCALREALAQLDLVLLDLGLPDASAEGLLRHLKGHPETSDIPVLVVTAKVEAAEQLRARAGTSGVGILLKPVSEACLRRAVDSALAVRPSGSRLLEFRQREIVRHLIVNGPDRLAMHVYRRLCTDRVACREADCPKAPEVLSWVQIAEWARLEGLLNDEQVRLVCLMRKAGGRGMGHGEDAGVEGHGAGRDLCCGVEGSAEDRI